MNRAQTKFVDIVLGLFPTKPPPNDGRRQPVPPPPPPPRGIR